MAVITAGIIAAAGAVGGAAISASGQKKAQKQSEKAYKNAQDYIAALRRRGSGYLAEAFGSELDPEDFCMNLWTLRSPSLIQFKATSLRFPAPFN